MNKFVSATVEKLHSMTQSISIITWCSAHPIRSNPIHLNFSHIDSFDIGPWFIRCQKWREKDTRETQRVFDDLVTVSGGIYLCIHMCMVFRNLFHRQSCINHFICTTRAWNGFGGHWILVGLWLMYGTASLHFRAPVHGFGFCDFSLRAGGMISKWEKSDQKISGKTRNYF